MEHVDIPTASIPAETVIWWEPVNAVETDRVDAIFASMDSDPDQPVWDGPPLIADIDGRILYTGSHRQAAVKRMLDTYSLAWEIPVVDLWDLIDQAEVSARTQDGEDWDEVVNELMTHHPAADELGWDHR